MYGFALLDRRQDKRVSHGVSDQKGDQHCESPRGHWSLQVTRRVGARTDSGHVGSGVRSWSSDSGSELGRASGFIRSNLLELAESGRQPGKGTKPPDTHRAGACSHRDSAPDVEGQSASPAIRGQVLYFFW